MSILARVSTGRILALAADLAALDRTVGGHELEVACERAAVHLGGGAHQVELRTYQTGSEHKALGWTRERRPYTEEAELWLLGPDGDETLLCRRSDNPACSMGALRSTVSEGEVFEVVDVGFGTRPTDYRSHRMPGKLALVSGQQFQAAMLEALAQRQAEGLLCGPGNEGLEPVPNRLADPSLYSPHRPFGFNLSAQQFNLLANLLAGGGEVRVRVHIQTVMDTGTLPVLAGLLEGSEDKDQRVLLVAELGREGSPLGTACLAEVVRSVSSLVVDGALEPLRRSLQVLLVPDTYGVVAWLDENRELWPQIKSVVHLQVPEVDSVSRVEVRSPPGRPAFVADLLDDHLRWASSVRSSFQGDVPIQVATVSDKASQTLQPFADPSVGITAASVCCTGRRAASHQGGMHGPLRRLTAALAWAAVDLCNLEPDRDLPRLLSSSQLKGLGRLRQRAEQLRERIRDDLNSEQATSSAGRHLLWLTDRALEEGLQREQQVLQSCGDYTDGAGQLALTLAEANAGLERVRDSLSQALLLRIGAEMGPRTKLVSRRRRLTAQERRAGSVVVHRRCDGPMHHASLLRDARPADRSWLAHNAGVLGPQPTGARLLQWVDGERTLLEIHDQLLLDHPQADLKLLWRYLEVLEGAGFVELKEVPTVFRPGEEEEELPAG
jgi:hypothetical protein